MTKASKTKKSTKLAKTTKQAPQRDRFIEFAKKHGADDPNALDSAVGQLQKPPKPKKK